MFVPREVWVTANFKETQLADMRPGQGVDIRVDAYPGHPLRRPRRQHPGRQRRRLQPAAAGERHRQLRQGGAARAGQDRVRQAARRLSRARHVGGARRQGAMRWPARGTSARRRDPLGRRRPQSLADRGGGLDRHLHAGARHLDRQCGAAPYRRQPGGGRRRKHLGDHHLSGRQRRDPADQRLAPGVVGRKRFYMMCVALFTVSSLLCGLAPNLPLLIFFRILQGLGGGGMAPSEQAILADTFPPEKRAQAFALYGVAVIVAPTIGPTIGGWITDNFSWHWIFFINVPIGVLSLVLVQWLVVEPETAGARAQGAPRRRPQGRLDRLRAGRAVARLPRDRARQGPARGLVPVGLHHRLHRGRRCSPSCCWSRGSSPARIRSSTSG